MGFRVKGPMVCHLCECGNHVWAPVSKGYAVLVSPEDACLFESTWSISSTTKNSTYVCAHRHVRAGGRRYSERMHRKIAQPDNGLVVDHVNLNSLDNRRENLRVCTPQQNMLNRRPYRGKAVPLKGVQRVKGTGKFKAVIRFNNVLHQLGANFDTPEQAHEAYLRKAKELHGEFFRADSLHDPVTMKWTCDEQGNWRRVPMILTKTAQGWSDTPALTPRTPQ